MKTCVNTVNLCGRIFEHSLTQRTVNNPESKVNGQNFIMGDVQVAVNADSTNVIPVHFSFISEMTKNNQPNRTYNNLMRIINEGKTVKDDGEDADWITITNGTIELNDYPGRDGEMRSVPRVGARFADFNRSKQYTNLFEADTLINAATLVEGNPENGTSDRVDLKGAVFSFRNEFMPITFMIDDQRGMDYFLGENISNNNMMFTKLYGTIENLTIKHETTEEVAFGDPIVKTTERHQRAWKIYKAAALPYDLSDPEVLTPDELTKMLQDRELHLASEKKRAEEYRASKAAAPKAVPAASNPFANASSNSGFSF